MQVFEGRFVAQGLRFGIVVSRFNDPIVTRLLEGAVDGLKRHGVADSDIAVVYVPGAFELPLLAKRLATSRKFDAVICLGAVIRGATPHFDYVCSAAASGIQSASLETGIPVIFSVLTTDTVAQAEERSGLKGGNKGFEGALAAIEMATLIKSLG